MRARTRVVPVPFVPEVRLHTGTGVVRLWEDVEAAVGRTGTDPPFWAFPWAGGQALARHVLDAPHLVAGRRVLDLASGSGLVAVAAALAGAGAVRAVDVDPLAVAAVRLNAAANGVVLEAEVADVLDGEGADPRGRPAQVVLAGDVFYSRVMGQRVLGLLERAAACGADVLVGDPGRAHLPRRRMELVAAYDVPVVAELEDQAVKRSSVWRLRRRPAATR